MFAKILLFQNIPVVTFFLPQKCWVKHEHPDLLSQVDYCTDLKRYSAPSVILHNSRILLTLCTQACPLLYTTFTWFCAWWLMFCIFLWSIHINTFCIFFFYFWRNAAYFQSELFRNVVQSARKSSECNVSKMNSCRSPNNERVTLWALTSISTKSCQVTINIQIQTISLTYHIHLLNNQ